MDPFLSVTTRYFAPRYNHLYNAPTEDALNRIARSIAAALQTPLALIWLAGGEHCAIAGRGDISTVFPTPNDAFNTACQWIMATPHPTTFPDARPHPILRHLLSSFGGNGISVAGVSLVSPEGEPIGCACAIDPRIREWGERDVQLLRDMAASAVTEIVLRVTAEEQNRLKVLAQSSQAAARSAERRYADLVNDLNAIVWEADAGSYRFTFVSQGAEALLGYTVEQWLTDPSFWKEHIHPEDREATVARCLKAVAEGIDHEMEYRMIAADGRTVWLYDQIRVIPAGEGRPRSLRGVMLEITERKRAEIALQMKENRFRALFENSSDDIGLMSAEGAIVYSAPSKNPVLGYSNDEYLGQNGLRLVHPDDQERVAEHLSFLVSHPDETITVQYRALHRNGSWRWIESVGKNLLEDPVIQAIVVNYRDITDRKQAEEEVRESEKRFRLIAETSNDIITCKTPDYVLLYVSPASRMLLGYEPEELMGRCCLDFMHPEDRAEATQVLAETLGNPERSTVTFRFRRKNGDYVWLETTSRAVLDPETGLLRDIYSSSRDITRRKEAEERVREANRQLEETVQELQRTQQQVIQQERLRAMGQMASGIAHDFNNSLSPILGFSEMLLLDPTFLNDPEKATHYLSLIHTAAQDASDVVNRLRAFYRTDDEEDPFRLTDLNRVVEQVVSLTQPRWKAQALAAGITINVETDLAPLPPFVGHEAGLREALTNLVFNAVDAMPSGGVLTLRTRHNGDAILLEVEDTGMGMTEEVRRRCLEPFFSTKGARGTGMGLATLHDILQRHHGALDIRSAHGQGTTFILHLPLSAPSPTRAEAPAEEIRCGALQILVVDDEPLVRELLADYLSGMGYRVTEAEDGLAGLQSFREGAFDLVIMDRAMPEMNGDQLSAALREIRPDQKIIMMTGFGENRASASPPLRTVDRIITKPIKLLDLQREIAGLCGRTSPSEPISPPPDESPS